MEILAASSPMAPIRVLDTLAIPQLKIEQTSSVPPVQASVNRPSESWPCDLHSDPNAPPPWWWLQKWCWQPVSTQATAPNEINSALAMIGPTDRGPDPLTVSQPHSSDVGHKPPTATPDEVVESPQTIVVPINYAYVSNLGSLMDVLC